MISLLCGAESVSSDFFKYRVLQCGPCGMHESNQFGPISVEMPNRLQ